jgi:hypothetical protein
MEWTGGVDVNNSEKRARMDYGTTGMTVSIGPKMINKNDLIAELVGAEARNPVYYQL